MRVAILIPTYNEKENIEKLLKTLLDLDSELKNHTLEILIVDDNSPDGTAKVVRRFQKKHKNIHLSSGKKRGLGKAMIRGYNFAMEKLNPDVIIANEADFAFDFKHVDYMLSKIEEGFDVVIASRHVDVGKTEGWTWSRKLNHWVANTLFAAWIAGVREVYDHNGAYRAIRVRGVLDKLDLKSWGVHGFAFFFLLIYKLTKVTGKIDEFPATYRFRKKGESKVSFNPRYIRTYLRDIFEYIKIAFQIRLKRV